MLGIGKLRVWNPSTQSFKHLFCKAELTFVSNQPVTNYSSASLLAKQCFPPWVSVHSLSFSTPITCRTLLGTHSPISLHSHNSLLNSMLLNGGHGRMAWWIFRQPPYANLWRGVHYDMLIWRVPDLLPSKTLVHLCFYAVEFFKLISSFLIP